MKKLKVYIFYLKDAPPMIYGVYGCATTAILEEIEKDCAENLDMFDRGEGDYIFNVVPFEGQMSFPETGQWDMPPSWELELIEYNKLNEAS